MPVLTAAITVLGLAGTPAIPGGPYEKPPPPSTPRTYSGDFTRLVTGTPGKPYGTFARVVSSSARTYSADFTRLTTGTPGRPYGAFTGKAERTDFEKFAAMSVVPVVTIGEITAVDLDTTLTVIPRASMVSTVRRALTASMTVKPVLTQARGQVNSTGTTPKSAGLSVVPVVGMSSLVSEIIASNAQSVIPVLAMASTVDSTAVQIKAAALSVIPVAGMNTAVNRINASQAWNVPLVAQPRVQMASAVKQSGEVDRITVNAWPKGRIRITKV